MDKGFEMKQLGVFQDMAKKGVIFRRNKPVYWSPSSRTALAEAELEYRDDHESTAAWVKFPVKTLPESLLREGIKAEEASLLIWTTTPWTLPANRAIAVNPDLQYAVVGSGQDYLIIAEERLEHYCRATSQARVQCMALSKGSELAGTTYVNPLQGSKAIANPLIFADWVSSESGTGLVHCAPGHGMDDYEACLKLGIPAFAPVDDAGCFTAAALPDNPSALTGESVLENGSSKVLEILGDNVVAVHKYTHKYPYDWRTKLPVIVRATEQWFADVGSIKELALKSLEDVNFIPATGRSRLESFVKGRSEWCISRQRAWGVPIPAIYDEQGTAVLTDESVAHIIKVLGERGSDAWWTDPENDPAWIAPGLLAGTYRRGRDTMDVWFDSGSSWTQTEAPADVYSEGTDQHRGWFQSSLLTSISTSGTPTAPFKTLITHGFTLDAEGRKMSKSIGNVIAPSQITSGELLPPIKLKGQARGALDALGPDVLRLWVASSDYTKDITIGTPILKSVSTSLIRFRTLLKMLLGSLHEPSLSLPLTTLDKIALVQLDRAIVATWENYGSYEFFKGVKILERYVNVELSGFYLEGIKDRLYCGDGGGVLVHIYIGLLKMLGPVTPLLVEEAWGYRPAWMQTQQDAIANVSVEHPLKTIVDLQRPLGLDRELYMGVEADIEPLLAANAAIKTAQEEARARKLIGSSLQSSVALQLPAAAMRVFEKYRADLEALFVVSEVELVEEGMKGDGGAVEWQFEAEFEAPGGGRGVAYVRPPKEAKCPRCWRYVAEKEDELCGRCEDVVGDAAV